MEHVNFRAVSLMLVVCLCLVCGVHGRSSDLRVYIRLIIPEPRVCTGSTEIPVEVIFTNTSNATVTIYESGVYDFWFSKQLKDKAKWKTEQYNVRKDIATGNSTIGGPPVLVNPHSSMTVPLRADISNSFFRDSAIYSLEVNYMKISSSTAPEGTFIGSLSSNETLFEMSGCEKGHQ